MVQVNYKVRDTKDVLYINITILESCDGLACVGNIRKVIRGFPSIDYVLDKKSGREQIRMQLHAYNYIKVKTEKRNNSDYNRLEIDFTYSPDVLNKIIVFLHKMKDEVENGKFKNRPQKGQRIL